MRALFVSLRVVTVIVFLSLMSLSFLMFSCSSTQTGSDATTNENTGDASAEPTPEKTIPPDLDLEMKAEDFECITEWTKVGRYRITNKLGFLKEALKVARSKTGGVFPVGTIIQLVPQEAMVKRRKGWNPKTNDWEFFFLKIEDGKTTIVSRGKEEVKNQFGGNCYACHSKAGAQWDLICSDTHGCDPLPFTPEVIEGIQRDDSRCKK